MDENILNLAPFVASFVETLVRNGKIGITGGTPRISEINTGCESTLQPNSRRADRFKLHLPYAGQTLLWETIFNSSYPSEPPDFIFLADDNLFRPEITDIKSLCNWNASDLNSLLKVIGELLSKYKSHHLFLLANSRMGIEYDLLMEASGQPCKLNDVEIFVARKNGVTFGPVTFLIKLRVDISGLPEYLNKDNSSEGVALLHVAYQSVDGGRVAPRLQPSIQLEQLFLTHGLRMTTLTFPQDGALVDYVITLQSQLKKLVETVIAAHEKRKEFVAAFLALFGSAVVEYNVVDCTRICFLFVWNDFMFLVIISLSCKFPQEMPRLILQSVYHTRADNSCYFRTYTDYPYSPRWSGTEMALRTRNFILEKIQEFQKSSVFDGI